MQENKYTNRRLRTSYLSTIMSISLVLFMLGLLAVIIIYAGKLSNYVKENIELSIVLNDEVKEVDIASMKKELDASGFVKSTQYVTKEEAAKKLQNDLGEDFVSFLGYIPLLPSIDVHLHAQFANPDSIKWIEKKIAAHPEVKEIYYQHYLVERVNNHLSLISLVILIFSSLLAVIAIALINNNIRLSLYSKRFLIRSMQLVGATQGFIRKPFIMKGMVHGFYGALIANILLTSTLLIVQRQVPELIVLQEKQMFGLLFLSIIIAGLLISFVSTFLAVRKYIHLKLDDLYF
jgi:cell division transport system permease protein